MPTLRQRIVSLLQQRDGLTDREITDALFAAGAPQQPVNQACRSLQSQNHIARRPRPDGKIGNFLSGEIDSALFVERAPAISNDELLSEDAVKQHLGHWLESQGWKMQVMWGREQGIDIDASKEGWRWIIEVKSGSRDQMRVNYFGSPLELEQKM